MYTNGSCPSPNERSVIQYNKLLKFLSFYHFLNKHTVFSPLKVCQGKKYFAQCFHVSGGRLFYNNNLPCCPKMLKNIFNSFFFLCFFQLLALMVFIPPFLLSNSPHLLKVNEIFKKKIECHLFSNFESVIRSEPAKLFT